MKATLRRFAPHLIIVALIASSIGWALPVAYVVPLPNGSNDFNAPGFVVRHAWVKFAMLAVRPLRGEPSRAQEDAKIARFFALNSLIADQERIAGDPSTDPARAAAARTQDDALRRERAGLKNAVQLILEGRLTRVIKEMGLTRHVGRAIVWPPVNIEFQDPPAVLVTSPRSEIRKESESLLQGDLPIERVQQIEAKAESDGKTSALVIQIGGIAMYPAIIPPDSDYHYILQDIAHEWMHHYLYFTPLGRAYFDSAKLTTLNETVANMAGREMGDRMFAEYPLVKEPVALVSSQPIAPAGPAPARQAALDFTTEMRNLRRNVEALLKDGRIADAERAMEQEREYLAANGYYIRRLNQAYFAFNGSYADSAGSIDPIGPKLAQLRTNEPTLADFVRSVRAFRGEADLDAALAATK